MVVRNGCDLFGGNGGNFRVNNEIKNLIKLSKVDSNNGVISRGGEI